MADEASNAEPETNYFVALGVLGTIRRVFSIFLKHYGLFLAISGAIACTSAALVFLSVLLFVKPIFELYEEDEVLNSYEYLQFPTGEALVTFAVDMLMFYALICVADGAIVRAVTEIYVHKVPTANSALAQAIQKPLQLVGSALVVGIPYLLVWASLFLPQTTNWATVIVLLIILALSTHIVTYPIYPAIMIEPQHNIHSAIQRSFQLTSGNIPYVLCILVCMWTAKTVAQLPSFFLERSSNSLLTVVANILSISMAIVFASLNSICQAVVYMNLRILQEGLDFETLAREIGAHQADYVNVKNDATVELGLPAAQIV